MPTYEYACKQCGERLEVVQSFTDDPLTECPSCGGELRKVFGSVGIVFKGSGFYKTDSRSGSSGAKTATKPAEPAAASADSSTSPSSSTPAAPAAPASSPSPTSTAGAAAS